MISAKDKFREGFIMLLRPFQFAELKNPIQKLTILWAYSEQPIIRNVLTAKSREKIEEIENSTPFMFSQQSKDEWLESHIEKVINDSNNYENLYEGEIVQCIVEGQTTRFYPDEYRILGKDKVFDLMQDDGYHTILTDEVRKLPDFAEKCHYLRSRGVSKDKAEKWTSLSYQSLVMYKPYYELLQMFCREHEIYPDTFYEEVEGISLKDQNPDEKDN